MMLVARGPWQRAGLALTQTGRSCKFYKASDWQLSAKHVRIANFSVAEKDVNRNIVPKSDKFLIDTHDPSTVTGKEIEMSKCVKKYKISFEKWNEP